MLTKTQNVFVYCPSMVTGSPLFSGYIFSLLVSQKAKGAITVSPSVAGVLNAVPANTLASANFFRKWVGPSVAYIQQGFQLALQSAKNTALAAAATAEQKSSLCDGR